ncbi:diguanylate cyclase regulator RdcB family protein [Enterobacter sp. Bisph1]|uniref:diguanylate cyclase regulator RdcB family protein n=1 Tax=Enterobacter sp. Bisph1 TaxID=1274399 RepID=UPI00057C26DA|nr:diguanylate cyclase regulator RdcB family protein [Enterobacter sp. Bisph1]
MKNLLLDGPGRVLECIHPKFIVDLVQGVDALRQTSIAPQQQLFRERLTQEVIAQTQLRPWAMSGVLNEHDALRLGLAEKLASMLDPGYLALTRITEKLTAMQQAQRRPANAALGAGQQYDELVAHFSQRAAAKEKALTQRGLTVQAGNHSEQVFTHWRAGSYNGWSMAGRCYIALEELRWGAFGDACRLANADVAKLLKDNLRAMAADFLAQGINAAPATRHFYHQWLATPSTPGLMDYKDLLGWLGDWCDADRHPICWSVTQSWQTVALGMPRLCSATRIATAMVDEIFGE